VLPRSWGLVIAARSCKGKEGEFKGENNSFPENSTGFAKEGGRWGTTRTIVVARREGLIAKDKGEEKNEYI